MLTGAMTSTDERRMPKTAIALFTPELLSAIVAIVAAAAAFAFGTQNLWLLYLGLIFILIELALCMLTAALDEVKVFGLKEFARFWLLKAVLLVLPLIGVGADLFWAIITANSDLPTLSLSRPVTKAMLIGVVAYQIKESLVLFLTVYTNFPAAKKLMHKLDRLMHEGEPPGGYKREYDPPFIEQKEPDVRDDRRSENRRSGSYLGDSPSDLRSDPNDGI